MNTNLLTSNLSELNFTAIDFETANEQRASICSFGYAKVRSGKIVEKKNIIVKPRELRFSTLNVAIHAISKEDVIAQPEFCDLWCTLESIFQDEILVAHNADFDIDALRQTLNLYSIPHPIFRYMCTLKLAQEVFKDLENYRLPDVAKYLGVELKHHNSQADAELSALIAIAAIPKLSVKKLVHDEDELTCYFSKKGSKQKVSAFDSIFQEKKIDSNLLKPNLDVANTSNTFYNQKVVFTGDLKNITRSDAAKKLQALGADINTAISAKTNIVVMGANAGPSKLNKIHSLLANGKSIRIMYEDEFADLMNG